MTNVISDEANFKSEIPDKSGVNCKKMDEFWENFKRRWDWGSFPTPENSSIFLGMGVPKESRKRGSKVVFELTKCLALPDSAQHVPVLATLLVPGGKTGSCYRT